MTCETWVINRGVTPFGDGKVDPSQWNDKESHLTYAANSVVKTANWSDRLIDDSKRFGGTDDGVVTTMIQSPPVILSSETREQLPDGTIVVKKSETISRKEERIVTSRSHSRQNLVSITSASSSGKESDFSPFDTFGTTTDSRFGQNVTMERRMVTGSTTTTNTQTQSGQLQMFGGEGTPAISSASRLNMTTANQVVSSPRTVLPAAANFFEQQRLGSVDRFSKQLMSGGAELSLMSNSFVDLLNQQRQHFESAFPAFKHLRTATSLFSYKEQFGGSTQVSDDGLSSRSTFTYQKESSMVTRTCATNGTMVNGSAAVVPYSPKPKMTTRAYFQYQGPKGSFKLMLDDEPNGIEDEHSESEEDDTVSVAPSEITPGDTESSLLQWTEKNGKLQPQASQKKMDKLEKAWCAAQELVETERSYVRKLVLLDQVFRRKVEEESNKSKMLKPNAMKKLFSNVSSLYQFHNDIFLRDLEVRLREWRSTQLICDMIEKWAPFFKLYSEYTSAYETITATFRDSMKNKKFAAIVAEIQRMPECENLPLEHHLISPVQRVMRYQLLVQEYLRHLPAGHPDKANAEKSLKLVVEFGSSHANEMMHKLDKYKNVLEVQELLGNQLDLVKPGRELVRQGKLTKISQRSGKHEPRQAFLFSDILLVCEERQISLSKYRLTAVIEADGMMVLEGDNLETPNTFYVRNNQKLMEFHTETPEDKKVWLESLWLVIRDAADRLQSFRRSSSEFSSFNDESKEGKSKTCSQCNAGFNAFRKQYECKSCHSAFCKKCCGHKVVLPSSEGKAVRICNRCRSQEPQVADDLKSGRKTTSRNAVDRNSILAVSAADPGILKGNLEIKAARKGTQFGSKFCSLHEDGFVLYCFDNDQDSSASNSLPMSGCLIEALGKEDAVVLGREGDKSPFVFKLSTHNRSYFIRAKDNDDMARWMAALELASKAQLTTELPD